MAGSPTVNPVTSDDLNPMSTIASDSAALTGIAPYFEDSVTDDETVTLGTARAGMYMCSVPSTGEYCMFTCTGSATAVSVVVKTAGSWAATDSDTDICLYVSSGNLTFKNRSGGALTLRFQRLCA